MRFWRIYHARFSDALSGEGARIHGGRWNPRGVRALYLSDTPSLAALEILAHAPRLGRAKGFVAAEYEMDARRLPAHDVKDLPAGWDAEPPGTASQLFGYARFADHGRVGFRVPSILVPDQQNAVLFPDHPQFDTLRVIRADMDFPFDPRLLK